MASITSITAITGLFVASVAAGVVLVDATRRHLGRARRSRWVTAVGVACVGGFVVPALFDDALRRAYLHDVKPEPVVASPAAMVVLHLTVGLTVTALAVLVYGFESRLATVDGRRTEGD